MERSYIVLQARIHSKRLPGKLLLPLKDISIFEHILKRLLMAREPDGIIVATTNETKPHIADVVKKYNLLIHIGSEEDVLERFVEAVERYGLTHVVRATGDNPLVCPEHIDRALMLHKKEKADLTVFPLLPYGTGIEVIRGAVLKKIHTLTEDPFEREHITQYIYRNRSNFRIVLGKPEPQYQRPELRLTVDNREDYEHMVKIYDNLYKDLPVGLNDVIKYIDNKKKEVTGMRKPRVLFCIAAGGKYGIGHLNRCFSIVEQGRSFFNPSIFIYQGDRDSILSRGEMFWDCPFIKGLQEAFDIDLIVSDMRDTEGRDIKALMKLAPVISLDDLGAGRYLAYCTIYPIPPLFDIQGNYTGSSYFILNRRIKDLDPKLYREKDGILISFGGTDPYNLTHYMSSILDNLGLRAKVALGPLYPHSKDELKGEVIENPGNFYDLINNAKLLITSFGITMYEAFFLKTPVILFNHSRYHYKLAKKLTVVNLGYRGFPGRKELVKNLEETLQNEKLLQKSAEENSMLIDGRGTERVVLIIDNVLRTGRRDCLFHHGKYHSLARTDEYTLLRCRRCKDIFLFELGDKGPIYNDKDYFLSEYKSQYGKSYIEDRENIVRQGVRRITIIERMMSRKGSLLDVGCAMGFFLELAQARGFKTLGVEISPYASEWARKNLSLDVITSSFLNVELKSDSFDVVTFFFTLEHFQDLERVMEKVIRILKSNGVFAVALPNRGGMSYRINREKYIKEHPRDHYFDTNFRNLKKFLRSYGIKKKKIAVTGIHPDRFFEKFGINRESKLLNGVYTLGAKLFKLGDTFEFYGVKK